MRNKKVLIIIVPLFILAVVVVVVLISLKDGRSIPYSELERYTPAQILNVYVEALNEGDYRTLNKILSERFLAGKNMDKVKKVKLSGVKVKPFEAEKYLAPEMVERYYNSLSSMVERYYNSLSSNECHYILTYRVDECDSDLAVVPGEEVTYFVRMVLEDNIWKIDVLATSP